MKIKVKKIGTEIREHTRYSGAYDCHSWKVKKLYEIYEDNDGNTYEKSVGEVNDLNEEDREDWTERMCTG